MYSLGTSVAGEGESVLCIVWELVWQVTGN